MCSVGHLYLSILIPTDSIMCALHNTTYLGQIQADIINTHLILYIGGWFVDILILRRVIQTQRLHIFAIEDVHFCTQ